MGAAMKRSLVKIPDLVMGPGGVFELVLDKEQPHTDRCRQNRDRKVNDEEWRKAAGEERPVAAVVLDHEEADKEARGRYHQQQSNPITVVESRPYQPPNDNEGYRGDHQLEQSAPAIRLAISGKQLRQRAGVGRA